MSLPRLAWLARNAPEAQLESWVYRDNLAEYLKAAWHIVEPTTSYLNNWHIECVAEHLQACNLGQITRLIVNLPPRYMKSTLISVMWPTWTWTHKPGTRWLFASYAERLSTKHSLQRRAIINSPWYTTLWPSVRLASDQNEKLRFENTARGYMMATSMHGSYTGEGGDVIVLDDPHKTDEMESDADRESVLFSWDQGWSTRLNDKRHGVFVIIMQRLHERDLVGHVRSKPDGSDWTVLELPAEVDQRVVVHFPLSGRDQVREAGTLLWPAREGPKEIATAKAALGSRGYAAQYLQQPVPVGGGTFKAAWWRPYRERPQRFDRLVMSMDTAFKENEQNDYSAVVIAGVLELRIYLLFACKVKKEFPELKRMTGLWWLMWGRPDALLIEDAASGQALIQEFKAPVTVTLPDGTQQEVYIPVLPVAPLGDKVARAEAASPMVEAGQVFIPDPDSLPEATWVPQFLVDTATFPKGEGRDLVDALSQLLNYLRGGGDFAGLRQFYREQMEQALRGTNRLCMRCNQPILDNVPFSRDGLGAYHSPRCPDRN